VQQLSSVYYQLIQDTDEGLYLAQQLSSEIKLRYEAAPGKTIYPTKHSWMLAWLNITEEALNPIIDSGWNSHGSDLRIRWMM